MVCLTIMSVSAFGIIRENGDLSLEGFLLELVKKKSEGATPFSWCLARFEIFLWRFCTWWRPAAEVQEGPECVFCMSAAREFAFLPCGHTAFCGECARLHCKQADPVFQCVVCRSPAKWITLVWRPRFRRVTLFA